MARANARFRLDDHGPASPWFDAYHDLDPATLVHDPLAHAELYGVKILAPAVLAREYERRADAAVAGAKDARRARADAAALRALLAAAAPDAWGAPDPDPSFSLECDDLATLADSPELRMTTRPVAGNASSFGAFW